MSYPEIDIAEGCLRQLSLEFKRCVVVDGPIFDFVVPEHKTYINFSAQFILNQAQFPHSAHRAALAAGFRFILISFNLTEADRPILIEFIKRAFLEQNLYVVLSKPSRNLLYYVPQV